MRKRHPRWDLPGRSTVCDILSRHGMVPKKRTRRKIGHPTSAILASNDTWCADFKGQFKTGDGIYCYPLTVTDGYRRYLLGCQGLLTTSVNEAKPVFTRLFREFGLPTRIRTDNGVPVATNTLARLSSLSGLVGAARGVAVTDRARQAAAERTARAHAQDLEGRGHPTAGG